MSICGYVPFYNNAGKVGDALRSLQSQDVPLDDVFAVDDGSTDGGGDALVREGIRVIKQSENLGRGAARALAMQHARSDLVVCCDATNVLPSDFVRRLLPWFDDANVAAVYGLIQDPSPRGLAGRWRARHLFKSAHSRKIQHQAPLITYGTIVRRSALLAVGNFNAKLRHTEDAELGQRLLAAGRDIVSDPRVPVLCNSSNSVLQVLERYWRWYAGADELVSWATYRKSLVYAIKGMVREDLRDGDPLSAILSLGSPSYQVLKSLKNRWGQDSIPQQ